MKISQRCQWLIGIFLLNLFVFSGAQAQPEEIRNRATPLENVTSAGQPDQSAWKGLAESGYTTVIDLRRPEEDRGFDERSSVEDSGMSYISLPVDGANGVTFENAELLDGLLAEIDGPVLIHCGSSNRVGALLALRESLNGVDDEAAIALGREAGLRGLEATVLERLAENPAP